MNNLNLYPLQVSASDFNMDPSISPQTLIIFLAVAAVIVGVVVILNAIKKGGGGGAKSSGGGGGGGGGMGGGGILSTLALRRVTRNIGLNSEQTKMLDFIFKTDQVMDPQKSLVTPALLDRHFRRAYRIIENASSSDAERQRKLAILFSTRNMLENSVIGGISSTQQIKEDTVFIINTGKEKVNVHMVSAKGDHLLVEPPKNVLGSPIKIQRGTRVSVLFFNKSNKGFSFETRVTGYTSHNGHPVMQLAHSNNLRFLAQRRFRRRQTTLACNMFLVYIEGSGKKQRLIVDKRRIQGNIADVSVGGCSIKVLAPMQVGARFKLEFTQGDDNIAALGLVLRSNRTGMNTIIHVKFLKVTQKSMNAINSYVYEYGRE